ncbi:MAG: outer membrane protein transport protein [Deltaproteobacteria bacterium]|nr:outer membrane protein transport protein [Deltaproteobacteria bacterium]
MKRISTTAIFWGWVLLPHAALASGFVSARFGGEHGAPMQDHPTAIYYNPAGLALMSGTRVYLEGDVLYRTASYTRPPEAIDRIVSPSETGGGTPAEAVSANSGKSTLGNPVAAPFASVVTDLGRPNLGLGLGFYVPFGGAATWDRAPTSLDKGTYPGAVDGSQRWFSIEGSTRAVYVTLAGAYRFTGPKLSLGIGLNYVKNEVDTVRARNSSGRDDLMTGLGTLQEGRSLLVAEGTTFSASAGIIWQPLDNVWVGASYQSQPGFGELTLPGMLTNKLGAAPVSPIGVEMVYSLPDVYRAGVRVRPTSKMEVRLSADYVRWSVMDKQCLLENNTPSRACILDANGAEDTARGGAGVVVNIQRKWHDAMGFRLGGSYWMSRGLEIMGGIGYDGNAIPDATLDPTFYDMPKIWGTFGFRTLMGRALALEASMLHAFYFERTTNPRQRHDTGESITDSLPSRNPDPAGTYNQSISGLLLALNYSF